MVEEVKEDQDFQQVAKMKEYRTALYKCKLFFYLKSPLI